nr:PREDICTED: histone H2A-Bbd type 2/3 [Rhinolophus sinicus]
MKRNEVLIHATIWMNHNENMMLRSSGRQRRNRSRSSAPELPFSVSHVERLLREGHYTQRLGSTAPVYLAAVIEYLTAKILELAGNEAQSSGQSRITPEFIDMAVHNNSLLSGFFRNTTISQVAPPSQQ